MTPARFELTSTEPESVILSIELRSHQFQNYAAKVKLIFLCLQMKCTKFYFFIFFFYLSSIYSTSLLAQTYNLRGNWEGTITMERNGRIISTCDLLLQIDSDTLDQIEGISWIWFNEKKATFSFKGQIKGDVISLNDTEQIEADTLPSGEWCMKIMSLTLKHYRKFDRLEGTWQGNTSFSKCTPGKIILKKQIERA
jgi:hypothetical protein